MQAPQVEWIFDHTRLEIKNFILLNEYPYGLNKFEASEDVAKE